MASLKELIDMTSKEIDKLLCVGSGCTRCGSKELPHPDEIQYKIGRKIVCAECYYTKLGEEIEKHPIGHPGIHRG